MEEREDKERYGSLKLVTTVWKYAFVCGDTLHLC